MEESSNQSLDLRGYVRILLHRWWVIVVCLGVTVPFGYFIAESKTLSYQATTRILVEGRFSGQGGSEASGQDLAGVYIDLIATKPIIDQVTRQLQLTESPSVSAKNVRSFIDVQATNRDPTSAANIANTTAEVFIQDLRERQFTQIAAFQASLAQYGVAQDPAIIASQTARLATLSIIEPASPPGSPSDTGSTRTRILSVLAGLLIAAVIIILLEQLREAVDSSEEIKAITGFEVLGSIAHHRFKTDGVPLLASNGPKDGTILESYNYLWTNLEFAALGKENGLHAILVTSAGPSEGKSTTVINLARVIAKDGKRVIVVDADLRRPTLHRAFSVAPERGLTSVLLKHASLEDIVLPTACEGLSIVPSGPHPPDPTHTLRSSQFRNLIEGLKQRADVVLIDTPPILAVADALAVAPLVDAVLMVVEPQHTTRDALKRAGHLILQAQPGVIGIVLNKVRVRGLFGSGAQDPYYYNYSSSNGAHGASRGRGWALPGFRNRGRKMKSEA